MGNPTEDRFWAKVDKSGSCWIWTAGVTGQGKYGEFHVGMVDGERVRTTAHRWSFETYRGEIPAGFEVDHLCRTRLCVRPDHLEAVTHSENQTRRVGTKTGPYNVGPRCPQGHERNDDNTGVNKYGARFCRPCARARTAAFRLKKKSKLT